MTGERESVGEAHSAIKEEMPFLDNCLDVRKWRCGGWDLSGMRAKVNGRWSYLFPSKSIGPMNLKEPISYGEGYRGPSFGRMREGDLRSNSLRVHPLRERYLASVQTVKAPLVTTSPTLKRESELKPPVWFNHESDTIPDIRVRTAVHSRRAKRDKVIRERRERRELANSLRAKTALCQPRGLVYLTGDEFYEGNSETRRPVSQVVKFLHTDR
jgi:hypothetical protein